MLSVVLFGFSATQRKPPARHFNLPSFVFVRPKNDGATGTCLLAAAEAFRPKRVLEEARALSSGPLLKDHYPF